VGVRMPGAASGLFDPKMVEQLIELEKMPIQQAEQRKEKYVEERSEIQQLQNILNELDGSLNGLKTKQDFFKLKLESSHPDIIDGTISNSALVGSYDFEVRGMARTEKELAYGFPDKDKTPVGFGFMTIQRDDLTDKEVVIQPGSTLQDVANQINDAEAGVRAMVINTKYEPEGFRLLVISEQSGKEAKISIDEDTTFLEFKEQVTGRDLDVLFEDVLVRDEDNKLEELIEGVVLDIKRSEPGTRVQVSVNYDVEVTVESIEGFVEKYNQIAEFVHKQFEVDPETKRAGVLAGDGAVKTIMRQLQGALGLPVNTGSKFRTLADIGITTDPKLGTLNVDSSKVKSALAEDYEGVANLFIDSVDSQGVAGRLGERLRSIRDPGNGVIRSRMRGLDQIIDGQDRDIERKQRMAEQREQTIRRRFSALEGRLSDLQGQGMQLQQRLGGQPQGGGQGG